MSSFLLALTVFASSASVEPPKDALAAALGVHSYQLTVVRSRASAGHLDLDFELDGLPVTARMVPQDLRADRFEVLVQGSDGSLRPTPPPPPATFRGVLLGQPDSEVRFTVAGPCVSGSIRLGARSFAIGAARSVAPDWPADVHALWDVAEVDARGFDCGSSDSSGGTPVPGPRVGTLRLTEIAFDTDVEYYQALGSSIPAVVQDIESLLNTSDGIFTAAGITSFEITTIVVRTAQPDPYTSGTVGGVFNQFRGHWNQNHKAIQRDVAFLMSGKLSLGGQGAIGSICQKSLSYALNAALLPQSLLHLVAAHELGHVFGANHCSGNQCGLMCPIISTCSPVIFDSFGPQSLNAISQTVASTNCLPLLTPPLVPPVFEPFDGPGLDPDRWWVDQGASLSSGLTFPVSPPLALELDARGAADYEDDEVRTNEIRLGDGNPWRVSYYTLHRGVEAGECLVVEYEDTTGVWRELNRITSDGTPQSDYELHLHPLPPAALHDACQLRIRTEVDELDDDWFVDHLQISLGPPEVLYCTAKTTSEGCVPVSSLIGFADPASQGPFELGAQLVPARTTGLAFLGLNPAALPFSGATLCVQPPLGRSPVQSSGGFGGVPCTGGLAADLDALVASLPGFPAGVDAYAQLWFRDPGDPTGVGLTRAVAFGVGP